MRITDSVYMVSGAAYGLTGNAFAILKDGKLIMIDSGENDKALKTILENIRYHRLDQYPVTHLLLTHKHRDHMGNAWYFREKGAQILCGRIDADGVENGGVSANDFGLVPFRTCKVDRRIEDGEILRINGIEFKTVIVPGHTNGGAFYLFKIDQKSFAVTGDTVQPRLNAFDNGFEAALGWTGSTEFNKRLYIESLEKALCVNADILLAGHGIPVMENGSKIIKMAYRKVLEEYR